MKQDSRTIGISVEAEIVRFDERIGATLPWVAPILGRVEAISSAELNGLTATLSSIAIAELSPASGRVRRPAPERVSDQIREFDGLSNEATRPRPGGIAEAALAYAGFVESGPNVGSAVVVQRTLRNLGMARQVVLPISAGMLSDPDEYLDALGQLELGREAPIVSIFAAAARLAVANATELAHELASIREIWKEVATARSDSTVWPLIDYCASHLAITAADTAADLGISTVAAQNAIDRFAAWGIVNQNSSTKRNRIWLVSDVLDSVEAFMARARQGPL